MCSVKKGVLKNFAKFTGKRLYWSLLLITLKAFNPAYLFKRDSSTGVFQWTFAKFSTGPILKYICKRLLLFSEIKTTNNVIYTLAESFIFNFRIYKKFSYLVSFANFRFTEIVFLFLNTIFNISHNNISNVSFYKSLNRWNAFSHYQKFVPIVNAQNLIPGFI